MKKFKLIDASFSYTGTCELGSQNGYLALNRFPKHVEWVHEGFDNYQQTFKNLESTDYFFLYVYYRYQYCLNNVLPLAFVIQCHWA